MINNEKEIISYDINEYFNDDPLTLDYLNSKKKISDSSLQIEAIVQTYFKKEILSFEVSELLMFNEEFKRKLLKNIQARMKNIISDSSTLQFKELVSVVNLLSFAKNYSIFEKYNEFSSTGISNLFRFYEQALQEQVKDGKEEFELTFQFYITLLDAFKELCIINSTDVKRKRNIKIIIDLMTESINMLKFSVALSSEKIEILSAFQGKLLLFFSNINYISTKNKSLKEVVSVYQFIFNQQIDGYYLIAGEDNFTSHFFDTLLSNVTSTLLLMLNKLDEYEEDYFEELSDIIEVYNKYCQVGNKEYSNKKDFKNALLQNLGYLYDSSLDMSYEDLLLIILNKNPLSHNDIVILHELVLFLENIKKEQLLGLLNKLLDSAKVKNDYYEDYKLKVIDVIINRLVQKDMFEAIEEYILKTIKYLKSENTASHLISSFSKIHLSIACYYSCLEDKYLEESQKEYFISEKICAFTLVKEEYKDIYETLLVNNASVYLKRIEVKNVLNEKDLLKLGQALMSDFFKAEEIKTHYTVNQSIASIIEKILLKEEYSKKYLQEEIEYLISEKIFFGLCKCKIAINKESQYDEKEVGYEEYTQTLLEDYVLIYSYSYSYNDTFSAIYDKNKNYIKNNIVNLILSYSVKNDAKKYFELLSDDDEDLSLYNY